MKKRGKDRKVRRRLIIVFLCAIMLPSLGLAYMGLRYIKQEQQSQEQLMMQGLKGTLSGFARETEENILRILDQEFDSLITNTSIYNSISPAKIYQYLSENPLLEEVFVLDRNGLLLFPRSFRAQNELQQNLPSLSPAAREWLISGEESEVLRNFDNGISYYTLGYNNCLLPQEKLAFLIRIARCQLKAGDVAKATQSYQKVLTDDNDRFYGEGVPYQFIAALQLTQLFEKSRQPVEAFNVLVRLHAKMISEFNRFDRQQFIYYLNVVHEELTRYVKQAGLTPPVLLDSLLLFEDLYLKEPSRNDFLQANVIPTVEIAMRTKPVPDVLRYALIDNFADSSIHIAFMGTGSREGRTRIIGARLSHNYLLKLVKKSTEKFNIGENLQVAFLPVSNNSLLTDETAGVLIAEEPLNLLEGTLRGYKFVITGVEGMSIKDFTSGGVMLYYGLILAIVLVIALGVTLIFHDISREQELSRMKADFISNVTHEIKTPIATICSLAENVNEGWITSAEKQKDYFRLIASEGEKLGHLVENTLDFSRIESGIKRINLEMVSIQEVIENTVERFRIMTRGQEIKLTADVDDNIPPVPIDKASMEQALLNLLDNALKYSPAEKIIMVTANVENDYLNIAVCDKGMGIDKKDLSRIFEKFYRSESGSGKNITGSGIGLTLVKEIVESHNGTIMVDTELNKGSTFTIQLPVKYK